jgi:predicted nucleic acid-binding protein
MALLDVNALVALAWDSHIHHVRIREWFAVNALQG